MELNRQSWQRQISSDTHAMAKVFTPGLEKNDKVKVFNYFDKEDTSPHNSTGKETNKFFANLNCQKVLMIKTK